MKWVRNWCDRSRTSTWSPIEYLFFGSVVLQDPMSLCRLPMALVSILWSCFSHMKRTCYRIVIALVFQLFLCSFVYFVFSIMLQLQQVRSHRSRLPRIRIEVLLQLWQEWTHLPRVWCPRQPRKRRRWTWWWWIRRTKSWRKHNFMSIC